MSLNIYQITVKENDGKIIVNLSTIIRAVINTFNMCWLAYIFDIQK